MQKLSMLLFALISFLSLAMIAEGSPTTVETPAPILEARALAKSDPKGGGELLRKAIAGCEAAYEKDPKDVENLFLLAQLQMELQNDAEAMKALDGAIALAPQEAKLHVTQGLLFRYANQLDKAEAAYQKAHELAPDNASITMELAKFLSTQKRDAEMLPLLEKVLKSEPNRMEALVTMALILSGEQKYAEAKTYWTRALELDPKHANANSVAAQSLQYDGHPEEATKYYLAAYKVEPTSEAVLAGLVQVYEARGLTDRRDKVIAKLRELHQQEKIKQPYFCRDRFQVGENIVSAYELYKLEGPTAVRYRFHICDKTGKNVLYVVTLGSYDQTTQIAQQLGTLKKEDRLFHIDRYVRKGNRNEHSTFEMFVGEPPYNETKDAVIKVIDGTTKPQMSSARPVKKTKKDDEGKE